MQSQTGSYVLTTLITPPFTVWLTTLANVKDELSITNPDDDTRLSRYIAQESAGIAGHCKRVFGLAAWQDEFRPQRGVWGEGVRAPTNPLMLSKWPLASRVVNFTGNTYSSQFVDGLSTTAGLYAGQLVFGPGINTGTTILSVNAAAASLQLSIAASATASGVALNTGLQVIETVAGVSTTLVAGKDFQVRQGSLLPGDEGVAELYRLNERNNPRTWPATQIVVVYQAGYALPKSPLQNFVATMPSDLEGVCIEIVVGRYRAKGRDPLIRVQDQPNLGRTEYWVGATPGQNGPYPNEIMSILDRYRAPSTAAA